MKNIILSISFVCLAACSAQKEYSVESFDLSPDVKGFYIDGKTCDLDVLVYERQFTGFSGGLYNFDVPECFREIGDDDKVVFTDGDVTDGTHRTIRKVGTDISCKVKCY